MKKQLLFFILLLLSTLSFAQSSLDSLRLVLPERHDPRSFITNFHQYDSIDKVITISSDGRAFLYDIKTNYRLAKYKLDKYSSISRNNKYYISRFDGETSVLDFNHQVKFKFGVSNCIFSDFIDNDSTAIFAFDDGKIVFLNLFDLTSRSFDFNCDFSSVVCNSNKTHLLICDRNNQLKVLSTQNMEIVFQDEIIENTNSYLCLFDFIEKRDELILYFNNKIEITNILSKDNFQIRYDGEDFVSYYYSSYLDCYFLSDEAGKVYKFNLNCKSKIEEIHKHSSIVTSLYYSKNLNILLMGSFEGNIIQYHFFTGINYKIDRDYDIPFFYNEDQFRDYCKGIIPVVLENTFYFVDNKTNSKDQSTVNFLQKNDKILFLKDGIFPEFQKIKKRDVTNKIQLKTADTCMFIYQLGNNKYLFCFWDSVLFYNCELKKYKSIFFDGCEDFFYDSIGANIILKSWISGIGKFNLEHDLIEYSTVHGDNCFAISQDTNFVACGDVNGIVSLLSYSNLHVLDSVNFNADNPIRNISFLQSGNVIARASSSKYGIINFKENIYLEIYDLPNKNYLIKLSNSPYYMCSKDASKMLHYVTPSLKVIGFEQLDPVYNRPDIVLDSIGKYFGGADAELVANYRQSWEKRINKLGLDVDKLGKGEIAVPSAEIVRADDIAYENKTGELAIEISANDAKYPLRRLNVYVNEVPLYGSAGISIAHLNKQVWDTTVSVPLSIGENKIQVSVMNELGLENFKYPIYVNYTPEKKIVAKTHFIGIGVNEFKEKEHNLKYCVDDVTDLAAEFNSNTTVTKLFTNQNATRENILKLKQYLKDSTTVNDKVIISCSSHGLLDDSLNFYLATHDVDFNNPKARGLKYEELEGLLDGIPARQKLLLLDACNSGENDKTELLKQDLAKNQNNMNVKDIEGAKGVIIQLEEENKSNFKKMNELFVNVRNNTGSVIISAAGGQESALEAIEVNGQKIENGAFTYSVLEFLKANEGKMEILTVNKLKQYVENRVEEITNGKQKPTSRQETMEIDWGVR